MPELVPLEARPGPQMTLEQILLDLSRFGKPRVSLQSSGWLCVISVYSPYRGTTMEIKSDFSHPSPSSAARQAYDRLRSFLKDMLEP